MSDSIHPGSLVTLRYRLSCGGRVWVSTMEGRPSTFQLGTGELAPPLEACLLGLHAGTQQRFELAMDAFGKHNPQLVHRLPRSDFPSDADLSLGATVSLAVGQGQQASGLVLEADAETVLLDLNHPLAGKSVCFEVDLIGTI